MHERTGRTRGTRTVTAIIGICLIFGIASGAQAARVIPDGWTVIPPERRIDWDPGVRDSVNLSNRGEIPNNASNGATLSPRQAGADMTAAIQGAIDQCGGVQCLVQLEKGEYRITDTLKINSSVVLRGAGMNATRIVLDSPASKNAILITNGVHWGPPAVSAPIAGGYTKGSSRLTFASPAAIAAIPAGALIAVYQNNDSALLDARGTTWGGLQNARGQTVWQVQMVRVQHNNGDGSLDLYRPLYWTLKPKLRPEVRLYSGIVENAGIEDLTVETANDFPGLGVDDVYDSIKLDGTVNCWVKNVGVLNSAKSSIWITRSLNCEVRGCYVGYPSDINSGRGYGYHLFGPNSDHLVEDNIAEYCRHSFVLEGAVSGSVIGYNLSEHPHGGENMKWVHGDLITHALHPFMNLYEGNVVRKWSEDYVHGSASHNTAYRNYIRVAEGADPGEYNNGMWAVAHEPHNYYMNVVGNVLGQEAGLTAYEGSWNCIYKLGYNGEGATRVSDRNVLPRLLRQSNYDFFNDRTMDPGATLLDSLYYSGKPSFFAAGDAWPPIGPAIGAQTNPVLNEIPAQKRYSSEKYPTE